MNTETKNQAGIKDAGFETETEVQLEMKGYEKYLREQWEQQEMKERIYHLERELEGLESRISALEGGVIDTKAAPEMWERVMVKFKLGSRSAAYRKIRELENQGFVIKRFGRYEWLNKGPQF
jgi:vacuolar-type H+-ATPase subunit D/Vma8